MKELLRRVCGGLEKWDLLYLYCIHILNVVNMTESHVVVYYYLNFCLTHPQIHGVLGDEQHR